MNTFRVSYKDGKTRDETVSDVDTVEQYVMSRFGLDMAALKEHNVTVTKLDPNKPQDTTPKKAAAKKDD